MVGLVDADGTLVEIYDYDVYGTRRLRDPSDPTRDCIGSSYNACASRFGNPRGYSVRGSEEARLALRKDVTC